LAAQDDHISALILRLRLAVSRAAQRDSLSWWDDEALTPGADLLLRRLFPRSITRAAWTLALLAARARHQLVLAEWPQAHHLFDLGPEVERRLDEALREQAPIVLPQDPIRSRGELAALLQAIAPMPNIPTRRLADSQRTTQLADEVASWPVADRAVALAWAYTTPEVGGLVAPFYLPDSDELR
jgi:hypothetical protein